MKNIIFFILLIPLFGIAQPEMRAMNLPLKDYFNLNQGNTKQMESHSSKVDTVPKPLVSMYLNTTDGYKMLLDSFYEVDFNPPSNTSMLIREYYKYDDKGNVILFTHDTPCEGCAISTYKIESEFDENSHCTMYLEYRWNFKAKQWVKQIKIVSTYDLNGTLINYTQIMWYNDSELSTDKTDFSNDDHGNILSKIAIGYNLTTSEWVNETKDEYAYKNGKCTLHIFYYWNTEASQWRNSTKEEDEYDDNGNQTSSMNYDWESLTNQWVGSDKKTSTYASNGKMTNITYSNWDATTKQWVGNQKSDYTFNANGNKIQYMISYWDRDKNQWINNHKSEYSYDTNGMQILQIASNWNTTSNQWNDDIKFESSYNAKELMISQIISNWNKTSNVWVPGTKYEYEYNPEGNNTVKIYYKWNLTNNDWDVWNSYNYYYSLHTLTDNLDITENQKVKLYPNPAHEKFTLEINDHSVTHCELFNSNGQLLKTLPVDQGVNNYTIRDLKEGIYLIKIKSKEGTIVKKIIKN